uniref:Uncharacterized protein n=1 Tax=Anopheles maculatus TaxID=74869 RepID=A0A182SLV2_9DIPT
MGGSAKEMPKHTGRTGGVFYAIDSGRNFLSYDLYLTPVTSQLRYPDLLDSSFGSTRVCVHVCMWFSALVAYGEAYEERIEHTSAPNNPPTLSNPPSPKEQQALTHAPAAAWASMSGAPNTPIAARRRSEEAINGPEEDGRTVRPSASPTGSGPNQPAQQPASQDYRHTTTANHNNGADEMRRFEFCNSSATAATTNSGPTVAGPDVVTNPVRLVVVRVRHRDDNINVHLHTYRNGGRGGYGGGGKCVPLRKDWCRMLCPGMICKYPQTANPPVISRSGREQRQRKEEQHEHEVHIRHLHNFETSRTRRRAAYKRRRIGVMVGKRGAK